MAAEIWAEPHTWTSCSLDTTISKSRAITYNNRSLRTSKNARNVLWYLDSCMLPSLVDAQNVHPEIVFANYRLQLIQNELGLGFRNPNFTLHFRKSLPTWISPRVRNRNVRCIL